MGIIAYDLWDMYYFFYQNSYSVDINKGNNKITEIRTILQRESQKMIDLSGRQRVLVHAQLDKNRIVSPYLAKNNNCFTS